jgi:PAS domain S-box-containing protein
MSKGGDGAEGGLLSTEQEIRLLVETIPTPVWRAAPDGNVEYVNKRALEYFGSPADEILGWGWMDKVHPDDIAFKVKTWLENLQSQTLHDAVCRFRGADGRYRWFNVRGEPLRAGDGRVLRWYGVLIDIDERKIAEEALRASEYKLRKIIETLPGFHWSMGPDGEPTQVSQRVLDYSGMQFSDFLQLGWERFLHPDDFPATAKAIYDAIQTGTTYHAVHRLRRADGEYRWYHATGEPLRDRQGRIVEWYGLSIEIDDRMKAEEALRSSEYNLKKIIETVPGLIWSNGADGEPIDINQRMLDYGGMRFEDFKYRCWDALVHPADYPEIEQSFSHAIETGTSYEGVMRLRRADGEFRWHHARCEPLRDQQGRVVQWYGLSVDIDERKKAEDQLRRSEAHLAEAHRLSQSGASVYNETTILYWSEQTYRIWGFDPAEGIPSRKAVFQRIHPVDRDRVRAESRRALGEKKGYSVGYKIVLPDGTVKHLDSISEPVLSASGELIEVIATQIDVTERKRAEQALRESEAKFRDYAETASDWFWEIGPDYKFTLLTENAFGSNTLNRIGAACWDHALDLETEAEKWRLVRETLDSRRPFRDFVYCASGGDGAPMYVRVSGKPMFDADGRFCGYRGTGNDVTALIQAREEHERLRQLESDLAHMNRLSMMGELAASLAHEIAQPIATARNNARAAMNFFDRSPPDPDQVREALTCVVDDTDRAGNILDRIRDHIKKAPPRKERVDLNQAITDVIALAQGVIGENGVSAQTRLSEGMPHVQADRVQVQQVVLNLILNAVEAMNLIKKGARELTISTERHEVGGVLVAVRDLGPGIDPKHLDHVFNAFYTTKSSGVGMGLSICRSIINAHGGRLWADVNTPRGAVFRFTLPGADKEVTH